MCGIAGIIAREPLAREMLSRVVRMNEGLVHRGPDGEGLFQHGPVALAMRRLSVTDVEALEGAKLCARFEGIIPALESAHAIFYLTKLKAKANEIVVLNLSGRGDKDLAAYSEHLIAGAQNGQ